MLDVKVDLVGDARALRLDRLGAEEGRDGDEEEAEREPAEDHGGEEKREVGTSAPLRVLGIADVATRSRAGARKRSMGPGSPFSQLDQLPTAPRGRYM